MNPFAVIFIKSTYTQPIFRQFGGDLTTYPPLHPCSSISTTFLLKGSVFIHESPVFLGSRVRVLQSRLGNWWIDCVFESINWCYTYIFLYVCIRFLNSFDKLLIIGTFFVLPIVDYRYIKELLIIEYVNCR